MPPKKKNQAAEEELGFMRAARFGRVKNTLTMGFVGLPNGSCLIVHFSFMISLSCRSPVSKPPEYQWENRPLLTNWPEPPMRKLPTMCVMDDATYNPPVAFNRYPHPLFFSF
jgi:hypothetical protein